jgi:hypothetical protein
MERNEPIVGGHEEKEENNLCHKDGDEKECSQEIGKFLYLEVCV